ncbi:UbiA family prenyltransferase [Gynuella sp.]|uniref:UbiA family prenyltransferase n=1 Tax=Gynuella sp. TaxID=2969146 RepID=UPI003D0DC610
MLKALYLYSRERCPPAILLVIAVTLSISVLDDCDSVLSISALFISATLFLFLIRLSDDICDLPIDRVAHPERLLCRDQNNLRKLKQFRLLTIPLIFFITLPTAKDTVLTAVFLLSVLLVCWLFFVYKPKLPTLVHTFLLNGSLTLPPLHSSLLIKGYIDTFAMYMAIYLWLGSFAHDLSHSLVDVRQTSIKKIKPLNRISQTGLAILSLVSFSACAATGVLMYEKKFAEPAFLILLLINFFIMFYLEFLLIKKPDHSTSKPFYIFGFVFFLSPVLAGIASKIIKTTFLHI